MNLWRNIARLFRRGAAPGELASESRAESDPKFAAAITALGAKLAKADGEVDEGEFAAFSEVFDSVGDSQGQVRRFYDLAGRTTDGFEGYARQLGRRYGDTPQVLEGVLDGLFHIAAADGAVTMREVSYLESVADGFGLSPLTFRRVKASHLGAPGDDPYIVLQVAPDVSDEALRAAWKSALSAAHPDRLMARGSADAIKAAEIRAAAINAAYDEAVREREQLSDRD